MKILYLLPCVALLGLSLASQSVWAASDAARDPHGYSGGYTLTNSPYTQAATPQLKLADEHIFKSLLGNRFEYDIENKVGLFEVRGWVGSTYERLVFQAEGEIEDTALEESKVELLWNHGLNPFWNSQIGMRADVLPEGENRQWLVFGLQGLAPYWFEVDVAGFIGEEGRSGIALELEYELLFTQKIILQPTAAFEISGKNDEVNGIGHGLSNSEIGLRLRFEYTRQFAPYVGIERYRLSGKTASYAKNSGESKSETSYVAGVRFWF